MINQLTQFLIKFNAILGSFISVILWTNNEHGNFDATSILILVATTLISFVPNINSFLRFFSCLAIVKLLSIIPNEDIRFSIVIGILIGSATAILSMCVYMIVPVVIQIFISSTIFLFLVLILINIFL